MSEKIQFARKYPYSGIRKHLPKKRYSAFGLQIRSEVPFMVENGDTSDLDVDVSLGSLPGAWLADPRAKDGYVEVTGNDIWFVWEDLGVMLIHDGKSLVIDPIVDVRPSLLNQAVQSAGLGLLLHQRNELTLHASAVEVDGGVIGFVGYKGAGKSTTAASLFAQGYPLVTDDLLVLQSDPASGQVKAFPGIPQLRLWPDAVIASLMEDPEMLPRNSDLSTKRLRDAGSQFTQKPLPLRAIYVLDFLEDPEAQLTINPMAPRDACIEMVRHSYALHYLGNEGATAGHLAKVQQLASQIPIQKLNRPRTLEAIPSMVNAIVKDTLRTDTIYRVPTPPTSKAK